MNPVSLEAIKLLLEMKKMSLRADMELSVQKMIEELLFIMEKDISHAFQQYTTVKLV